MEAGDVVFGVFKGVYSDWKCVGWFPDAASAYKYCDVRNDGDKEGYDGDRYYVIPLKRMKCEFSGKLEDVRFRYEMYFEIDCDGEFHVLKLNRDGDIISVDSDEYDEYEADVDVDRAKDREKSRLTVNKFGGLKASVVIPEYDEAKAVEIAEDAVEQWKMDIVEFLMEKKEARAGNELYTKEERARIANQTWMRAFDAE